jgi:penicillin amidase
MRGSLPQLDGERHLAGLGAAVKIERDALGVVTVSGASRVDVARALGFAHAQDRYFQMDLMRRRAAGELSEIFGEAAVELDKSARLHGFRRTAEKVVATLPADQRTLLEAYVAGVNAGLTALPKRPWEYLVLRTPPQSWRAEDSVLCVYAMWFDLQDSAGHLERCLAALRQAHGVAALSFFAPVGDSHDAALDGSEFPTPELPPLRLKAPAAESSPTALIEAGGALLPGSNNFALSGAHTATGAAMLENDMHLSLALPNVWYRATMQWTDESGPHRVSGVTLPGVGGIVAGSNGHIAWGNTNAYVDTSDVVIVETEATAGIYYRTPHGWASLEERKEQIMVKNGKTVEFVAKWTEWGPVIAGPDNARYLVLRWTAHDPESTNFTLLELEHATTVEQAVAIAHRAGLPNQNLLIADAGGQIAWTVSGRVPRRIGFDGRLPVSWAFGDRKWDGWLPATETPVVSQPADGILWSANNRLVGGDDFAKLGDSGYADGARAGQIRDDLRALTASGKKAAPADLLAVALDDRGLYLNRWQELLLRVLNDEAVAQKSSRAEMREFVRSWGGRASVDSVGYRLVRNFRSRVIEHTLAPFAAGAENHYERFNFRQMHTEDAVWRLVEEKPARLLNPRYQTWDALLLTAADDVVAEADKTGVPLERYTWGARNTLKMQHPFSRFLPASLARLVDMPYEQVPGDDRMPRVQSARFGASSRIVVSPGHEAEGILHLPGGQSGHPMSAYYRAGHTAWVRGEPTPFLPGPAQHTLLLKPELRLDWWRDDLRVVRDRAITSSARTPLDWLEVLSLSNGEPGPPMPRGLPRGYLLSIVHRPRPHPGLTDPAG